jgi:hypothetical protein
MCGSNAFPSSGPGALPTAIHPDFSSSDQPSGSAAKSRLAFLYHPIPDMGRLHLPFISFKAPSCVVSPLATISFRCLSCAFMTSSAVFPWCGKSHGPPNCLQVIVFISLDSFVAFSGQWSGTKRKSNSKCLAEGPPCGENDRNSRKLNPGYGAQIFPLVLALHCK